MGGSIFENEKIFIIFLSMCMLHILYVPNVIWFGPVTIRTAVNI